MTLPSDQAQTNSERPAARDTAYWAKPTNRLKVDGSAGTPGLNLDGRQVVGPLQGFGQMWQKTYRVRLSGAGQSPIEVIKVW